MHRRAFLRRGAAVAVAGGLAGCSSGGPADFTLSTHGTTIIELDDGRLAVEVTVTNTGDAAQSGIVYVTATLNGEKSVELQRVTLAPHATRTVTVPYDAQYSEVESFSASASVRRADDDD
ncbi:hypothetical protein [Salarchaeum sp. JOR-1]|uniref:hypothetical protein n=1 Tax=Salarchaeum sp. JOR-1 TaxID=2599399 RepID=UPI00119868C9|nr:hypothetical protein [Salarchaeum sp. JOR-1]QDX41463.1 hypothetical protein FQU85_11325 [Salarchaeum sp. JOR-1]